MAGNLYEGRVSMPEEEMTGILRAQALRYPKMEPQDAVKLLYQAAFGCGHAVNNRSDALRAVSKEYEILRGRSHTAEKRADPIEPIGGGYARLWLGSIDTEQLTLRNLCDMFTVTASQGTHPNAKASFARWIKLLRTLTSEGVFRFSKAALDWYLIRYREAGYPAVSHSETFRAAYRPAYRIVDARYARLLPVIAAVNRLRRKQARTMVGIDGHAASGKTTAADLLSPLWHAPVIHTDDFFLPAELRTEARYAQPGGNFHYERFAEEVAEPLRLGKPLAFRCFSCQTMQYDRVISFSPCGVVLVEGVYALHPTIRSIYDLKIFFSISPALQQSRILERNGEAGWQQFQKRWIPLENTYFKEEKLSSFCDLVL